jgi:hypothetical protein
MSSFPANKLSGLGLINERVKSLETSEEYIFLNITIFNSVPAQYGQFLFQNKVIVLAELPNTNSIGIPHPTLIPRVDGYKIRFISNFGPRSETATYQFYALNPAYGYETLIHRFFGQGYLTLVWNETQQTWFPVCDIINKNASVIIAAL